MKCWKKIIQWEKKIEKKPKIEIIKILIMVFGLSVVCGCGLSVTVNSVMAKIYSKSEQEIKKMEIERINKLIETADFKY